MTGMEKDLLPCPFCGAPAYNGEDCGDHGTSFVECSADCAMNVRAQRKTMTEAAELWNRRPAADALTALKQENERLTAEVSDGVGQLERLSSSRNDDVVAANIKVVCDECVAEEREFCCHDIADVVIVNGKVVCKDCVLEFYPRARVEKAPDIAKKLQRQRMNVAQQQKRMEALQSRAETAEARIRVLEDALRPFAVDASMCAVNADYERARSALDTTNAT